MSTTGEDHDNQAGTDTAAPAAEGTVAAPAATVDDEIARLRAQVEALQAQRAAVVVPQPPAPQVPVLPVLASDPDIMGLTGVKPLRLTTSDEPRDRPRHPLFYIDDKPVTIPDEVPQVIAVNYMRVVGENTEQALIAGQSYLLREMLGDDGYQRLCSYRDLTRDQLAWIISTCNRIALGQLEVPKES